MIARVWHGWTSPENADRYDRLLKTEIFRGIESKRVKGYLGIELLRRNLVDEVEFVTIMWFESLDAVKQFAGADYELPYVPDTARALLKRFDARSHHYRVSKPGRFSETEGYIGRWW